MSSPREVTSAADEEALLDWCASRRLWRVTPIARATFGRHTVWHAAEESARKTQGVFAEGLADPAGLFVADVEPRHVMTIANGRTLPSDDVRRYAGALIAENAGHQWLALFDGPRPGGTWEMWVRLANGPLNVRPVEPDADVWTVPRGWE